MIEKHTDTSTHTHSPDNGAHPLVASLMISPLIYFSIFIFSPFKNPSKKNTQKYVQEKDFLNLLLVDFPFACNFLIYVNIWGGGGKQAKNLFIA